MIGAKTKVVIVEDHPLLRQMLGELVMSRPDLELVGEAASAEACLELLDAVAPDLALINVSLPGMNGIDLVAQLLERRPHLKCIVVTSHAEERYVKAALEAGTRAYVQKGDPEAILETVDLVLKGETVVRLEESV